MKKRVIQHETKQLFNTWRAIKQKYLEALVVIRNEEAYTTFDNDAIIICRIASVKLTNRKEHKQCNFACHRLDGLLSKLIKAGYRIAICDQLETLKR